MSHSWNRLFIAPTDTVPSPAAVATALQTVLEAQGYDPYDPFPGGTGTPLGLKQMVKLFVAPPQDGWITVLGKFPDDLLLDLHQIVKTPVIVGWLTDDSGSLVLFADGARRDDPAAFEPYKRTSVTLETLQRAFAGELAVEALESDRPPVMAVGADSLPPELRQLAEDQGADPAQAGKLFEKMGGKLFKRMSKQTGASPEERDQAQAMFMGGGQDAWNSLHGQRVRAIISVLTLPDNWRTPTQDALRDAYQIHRLRQRAPRMALMPGDKETMDTVPNALDYLPVYMGRR
jgi:hypothetical protein